jgi:cysteine desulfurase
MTEVMRTAWGNPSAQHPQGAAARAHIETARRRLLAALGDAPDQRAVGDIVWTSGCTEADALAVLGAARTRTGSIVLSSIEHPAVGARGAAGRGAPGRPGRARSRRRARPRGGRARRRGRRGGRGRDGAERDRGRAAGRGDRPRGAARQPDVPHPRRRRAGARQGRDRRRRARLRLARDRGAQGARAQGRRRAVAARQRDARAAVGRRRAAARAARRHAGRARRRGARARRRARGRRAARGARALARAGRADHRAPRRARRRVRQLVPDARRSPHILALGISGVPASALRSVLASRGVYLSTGSACEERDGHGKPSPVLVAIGVAPDTGMCRLSFGLDTTADDADGAARTLADVALELSCPRRPG